MNQRRVDGLVAANVAAVITHTHSSQDAVAEAAGMGAPDLVDRLNADVSFAFEELVRIGGFLRVGPARFFEGVNA